MMKPAITAGLRRRARRGARRRLLVYGAPGHADDEPDSTLPNDALTKDGAREIALADAIASPNSMARHRQYFAPVESAARRSPAQEDARINTRRHRR